MENAPSKADFFSLPKWLHMRVVHVEVLILFLLESGISYFWNRGKSCTALFAVPARYVLAPKKRTG